MAANSSNASKPLWQTDVGGIAWKADRLEVVAAHGAPASEMGLSVEFRLPETNPIRLTFHEIRYQPNGGRAYSLQPRPSDFCIQQPYLVVYQEVASAVGLRSVIQLFGDENGVAVDVRLETVAPLDEVQFDATLDIAGFDRIERESLTSAEDANLICYELEANQALRGALLLDMGGGARPSWSGEPPSAAHLAWFQKPLEKGVILIGRLVLIADARPATPGELRRKYAEWLKRPTFL